MPPKSMNPVMMAAAGLFFLHLFVLPPVADAVYYKYRDGKGTICITNDVDAVPKKFRGGMQIITDETLAKKDKGARRPTESEQVEDVMPAAAPQQPTSWFGRMATRFPWVRPALFLVAVSAAFCVVSKLASLFPSPMLARIVYIAFFLVVFTYGYKAYADYTVQSYFTIKGRVLTMFSKSNERIAPEAGDPSTVAPRDRNVERP